MNTPTTTAAKNEPTPASATTTVDAPMTPTFEFYTDRRALCQPGAQAKDAIAPRGVSHRKMMTMTLPYLRRNRAWLRHGGIDCSCCASRSWLVFGCGGGWGVHSCG